MAKDKAACVARQAAVSRHGVGLGSRRAQGRWGAQGERAGAGRASVLGRAGRARWGAGERAGACRARVARVAGGR